jgi:ABC-type uncharacterized transport system auxiliary subunit
MPRLTPPGFAAWAAIALAAAVAACSSPLEKPPIEQRYYTLDVTRPDAAAAGPGREVLAVRRFRASPGYEGRELVFGTGNGAYRSDFYNVFFAAPASMLADETREWLDRSGLFRAVVSSTSQVDARYALEGALVDVHGEESGGAHRAVLEAQFLLLDVRAPTAPILFQRQYRQSVPVADGSAAALVGGLNTGLAAILTALEADLAPVVRGAAPAGPR